LWREIFLDWTLVCGLDRGQIAPLNDVLFSPTFTGGMFTCMPSSGELRSIGSWRCMPLPSGPNTWGCRCRGAHLQSGLDARRVICPARYPAHWLRLVEEMLEMPSIDAIAVRHGQDHHFCAGPVVLCMLGWHRLDVCLFCSHQGVFGAIFLHGSSLLLFFPTVSEFQDV
jgi:hypothetical protein